MQNNVNDRNIFNIPHVIHNIKKKCDMPGTVDTSKVCAINLIGVVFTVEKLSLVDKT